MIERAEEAVWITAQEAAERLLTIKIAGVMLFAIVVLGGMWLIIRWKYSEDRRRTEAENAKERIKVTENIGTAMTEVLKQDSGWKTQYYILKSKHESLLVEHAELQKHCKNMEDLLETAKGANGFTPQVA